MRAVDKTKEGKKKEIKRIVERKKERKKEGKKERKKYFFPKTKQKKKRKVHCW